MVSFREIRHDFRSCEERMQGWVMAKVIEFYIPTRFRKSAKWIPEEQRGKLLEFRPQLPKSA